MTKKELESKVNEIRGYEAVLVETNEIIASLKAEVIAYMVENNLETEVTDSAKIIYKEQTRSTLDKKRLEEDLGSLEDYTTTTCFNVLRIK